ncbi:MAG TPA: DUF4352 domain-containing protein [Candidatus Saccharibacteria bacterium]|nr:DUF4352 domain-containing protein [Candidatus Saccharibacteria bacterium]
MNTKESKPWYKKWWVWLIIIIVLIGIGGAAGNKNDTATKTGSNDNSASEKRAEEKTEFKVGETATFDNKSITVTDVQRNYDTGNQFAQPESGKEFVIITVNITNNSDKTLDYNTYEFKMQDSNGVQQSEAITALSEGKLNSGSLAAGGKVTGKLAYEVPKDDAGLKLLYQNFSFFDNKAITFNLQ